MIEQEDDVPMDMLQAKIAIAFNITKSYIVPTYLAAVTETPLSIGLWA
jgi:hypothetical protein